MKKRGMPEGHLNYDTDFFEQFLTAEYQTTRKIMVKINQLGMRPMNWSTVDKYLNLLLDKSRQAEKKVQGKYTLWRNKNGSIRDKKKD